MKKRGEEFPHIDFIGVGVNKAATTWIYQCLREHPEVCMSKPKETSFFINNYSLGARWFKKCFGHCTNERVRGEYTPGYLSHPEAPERIKKHAPHVKFILCLRNPVELFESAYNFRISQGKLSDKDINAFIEKTLTEKESFAYSRIEKGLYAKHLQEFLKHFPREQILILLYEDIEKDPLAFVRQIYAFLGVDSAFTPSVVAKRINASVANRVHFRFLARFLLSLRKHIKQAPFGRKIADFLKLIGVNAVVKFLLKKNTMQKNKTSKETQKYKINEEMSARLYAFYEEDMERLSDILSRDLSSIWYPQQCR